MPARAGLPAYIMHWEASDSALRPPVLTMKIDEVSHDSCSRHVKRWVPVMESNGYYLERVTFEGDETFEILFDHNGPGGWTSLAEERRTRIQ